MYAHHKQVIEISILPNPTLSGENMLATANNPGKDILNPTRLHCSCHRPLNITQLFFKKKSNLFNLLTMYEQSDLLIRNKLFSKKEKYEN